VSQTMSAREEESTCSSHSQMLARSSKRARMSEAVGDQAEDTKCQLSVSNTSYVGGELQQTKYVTPI